MWDDEETFGGISPFRFLRPFRQQAPWHQRHLLPTRGARGEAGRRCCVKGIEKPGWRTAASRRCVRCGPLGRTWTGSDW